MMDSGTVRVLLVDDEESYAAIRDLLAEASTGRYVLDWEATYGGALEATERDDHDVYLIGCPHGEADSLELARDARKIGWRGPMILLAGEGYREDGADATAAGVADCLVKGQTSSADLDRSIRYSLNLSRLERERAALEQ